MDVYTWILGMCKHLTHRHKPLSLSRSLALAWNDNRVDSTICDIFVNWWKGTKLRSENGVYSEKSMWRLVIKQCWYHCQLSNSFSVRYDFRFYGIMVFTLALNEPIWLTCMFVFCKHIESISWGERNKILDNNTKRYNTAFESISCSLSICLF